MHDTHGGHARRQVEREVARVVRFVLPVGLEVVHVRVLQSGHEEPASPVDHQRFRRNDDTPNGSDFSDPAALDENGLVRHRRRNARPNDRYIDEGQAPGLESMPLERGAHAACKRGKGQRYRRESHQNAMPHPVSNGMSLLLSVRTVCAFVASTSARRGEGG